MSVAMAKGPLPLLPDLPPLPEAVLRQARLQAAAYAVDARDLADLLETLGLKP